MTWLYPEMDGMCVVCALQTLMTTLSWAGAECSKMLTFTFQNPNLSSS